MESQEPGKLNLLMAASGISIKLLPLPGNYKRKQDDMSKRFISIWFRCLKTDWLVRRKPGLKEIPFVLASPDHGRMVVTAVNLKAKALGVDVHMTLADARAIIPSL